jgi:hypothetical protein
VTTGGLAGTREHARPALDVAAKWPALALYDKQTRLQLKLRSLWSMQGGHGPTRPCSVVLFVDRGKEGGRGAFKILDVAMSNDAAAPGGPAGKMSVTVPSTDDVLRIARGVL